MCNVWDFRFNSDSFDSHLDLIDNLKGIAKKWAFQEELADSGYKHYQGRLSLIKKRRKAEKHLVLKLFKIPPNYIDVTVSGEAMVKGDAFYDFYGTKEDSRIAGPWTDRDVVVVNTIQLENFKKCVLYDYQEKLIAMATEYNDRVIDLVYDPHGDIGKSIFSEYLESLGVAEEIPPFRLMDDIFQWVASRPIKKCYIVDMPCGMKKDKLGDFYSGIEVIKNGVAFDKRYKAHKIRFDRPRIFLFSNALPRFSLMSKDRWRIWEVDENKYLKKYNIPL